MRAVLGLRVDEPRPGGSGNSNDGNAARKAFQQVEDFAAATGVDQQLIWRLHVILQTVSSCLPISTDHLRQYCNETAELYVHLYGWYPMSCTLHRLLMHSADVAQHCLLPVGMMSEEAAEARHKHVRLFRLHRARRDTRLHTIADIFGRLLVTSDPVVSSLGVATRRNARRNTPLLPEVLGLLKQPDVSRETDEEGDEDTSPNNSNADSCDDQ